MTRQSPPAGPDRVPDDLDELLRNASHRMRHRWVQVLQPWELSPHHARALRAIVSSEPLRLSELAERLRVANRSVTDVVDALVDRGLAVREAVPGDRRATAVRATDAGRELLDDAEQARRTDLTDFFGRLTERERRQLAGLLRKLIDTE
ncbi:MarR family winged helix-turn-helix transcriptional regulator [Microlunatus soli]|uniref:DNA-binding transcriptional regulator, MarR family n=1 Tax=Microlunatus soli TaxID=630515 RepID=A0A1H1X189_9ACTN|nr:MarR family transcriptional regulator [Microlunatus soli]SDT03068.1 DNA-binding transcriptional regulator, MarR family [Microlunatus soli]